MADFITSLAEAKRALTEARQQLSEEIQSYPTPISGCDAQFNHLLAERTKIQNALNALSSEVFVPTPRALNVGDRIESR